MCFICDLILTMSFCKPVWGIGLIPAVALGVEWGLGTTVCSVGSKWLFCILSVFRGFCRFSVGSYPFKCQNPSFLRYESQNLPQLLGASLKLAASSQVKVGLRSCGGTRHDLLIFYLLCLLRPNSDYNWLLITIGH